MWQAGRLCRKVWGGEGARIAGRQAGCVEGGGYKGEGFLRPVDRSAADLRFWPALDGALRTG
eukprot:349867-Chlamydomonas_euryale.AAC.4